jgi:Protein of unknown function (DUF2778)
MMVGINANLDCMPYDRAGLARQVLAQAVPCAAAVALSAALVAAVLHRLPPAAPRFVAEGAATNLPAVARNPTVASARAIAPNPYGELIDPRSFAGSPPVLLSQSSSLEFNPDPPTASAALAQPERAPASSASEAIYGTLAQADFFPSTPKLAVPPSAESAPLPPPRPAEFGSSTSVSANRHPVEQKGRSTVAAAAPDNRTFFQKLFGLAQTSGPAVAYASAESAIPVKPATVPPPIAPSPIVPTGPSLRYDRLTAVYDVAAHTVYMPDGTRMEAHSGLGDRLDDPRYVSERGRGPTPPHVYELEPREASFHGVQALRLTPVGDGDLFGRAGLLAHPYMLGANGDSNGCVSFKDYDAFLQAYRNGQVKRLAVVASLN